MAKGIHSKSNRFFFTVESHVGPGCPNKAEDVLLVQLGYASIVANNPAVFTPQEKAVFAKVVVGAPYTGMANDPLTLAIKTHQKNRGGTQDGKVSPMPNGAEGYDANHSWMIVPLNNNMKDVMGTNWPRLEKHPKFHAGLGDLVSRTFAG